MGAFKAFGRNQAAQDFQERVVSRPGAQEMATASQQQTQTTELRKTTFRRYVSWAVNIKILLKSVLEGNGPAMNILFWKVLGGMFLTLDGKLSFTDHSVAYQRGSLTLSCFQILSSDEQHKTSLWHSTAPSLHSSGELLCFLSSLLAAMKAEFN